MGILGGGVPPLLQILTLFQTKNVIFHTRFQTRQTSKIHNCFQTWPLERNYVTLNYRVKQKILQIHVELACFSFFLTHLELTETINTFIHSRISLENHPDSRPKWAKTLPDGADHTYKGVSGQSLWFVKSLTS